MHRLHELKNKLWKELDDYSSKSSYSHDDIATIKNLISSINKICERMDAEEDEEYSNSMGYSRRRKRDSMGRYSTEYSGDYSYDDYSRDDYSRDTEMARKLYEIANHSPDHQKREIMKIVEKLNK